MCLNDSAGLVDTHCHLNFPPLCDHLTFVLGRAKAASVGRIVVPAFNLASFAAIETLASQFQGVVFPAFGLHPWVADEPLESEQLAHTLLRNHAVAIGEIGLDFKVETPSRERQLEVCRMQIELAVDLNLPVILHCRGAFEELLKLTKPFGSRLRAVVHAWSRHPDLALQFVRRGFFIGFGGTITRPSARGARASAAIVPLEAIVLETDAPAIGLEGVPHAKTEPCHISDICRELASIRKISFDEVARATTENAIRLFTTVQNNFFSR